jgi:multicomponent Na+:H+ antiporter subunit D
VIESGTTVIWFGGWHPGNVVGLGIAFAIDPAGAAVATLVCAIVIGALVFSRDYFDEVGTIFYVLILAMLGAMIAFAYAADAFDLFVFYEVFSVAAYALAAYRIEAKGAFEGALQFALTNTVAGLFILVGISLLEGRTGELNLAAIGHSLVAQHDSGAAILAASSLAFVAIGLFTRGGLVPLHFWFDEAHATAPTPLCIILSGAMAPLALFGFARFYWDAYAGAVPPSPALHALVTAIGLLSAIVGSLMCLRETQLKRAVAFSTVAHGGAALVAIGAFDAASLRDAALYVTAYGFGAAALFAAIAILRLRAGSGDLRELAGRGGRLRFTGIAFALGTIAIPIVPLGGSPLAHACAIVVGIVTGGAFGRTFLRVFVQNKSKAVEPRRVPWFMLGPAFAFGFAPLAFALPAVRDFAALAAARLVDASGYAATVFGRSAPAVVPPPHEALKIGLVLAPLGAIAVAWLALTPIRGIARERRAWGRGLALGALVRLHDGNSGQFIAWIAGTAAVAATVCTWDR